MTPQVIVVGAAVAGSAVANALGQLGVPTLLLEKGAERDNSTRGDILHPPTLRFLDRWGVLGPLHEDGALPMRHIAVSHRTRGLLAAYPVARQFAGPAGRSVAIPHDRIEAVMKASAERWPSVQSERGRVTGLIFEAGRAAGVRVATVSGERAYRAALIVGCDGGGSVVRRELGIGADRRPYNTELLYISSEGETSPPAAMHFHIDEIGVVLAANRPAGKLRIAIHFAGRERGDLLKHPDPYLRDYVTRRVPPLANARIARDRAHVYSLVRLLADRFAGPGAALVGDSAHQTHPTGATGMNLAISGAARLVDLVGPVLLNGAATAAGRTALQSALDAYDAERRPAAAQAIEENHRQAINIWQGDLFKDPDAYARAADPTRGWGVGGAGWGQDPAALEGAR